MSAAYPYAFINNSGETMPAFSVMRLSSSGSTTVNKRLFVGVTKPDGEDGLYLINSPVSVASNAYGHAALAADGCWVKYSGTAPTQGDSVGPETGWTVTKDGVALFVVWHVDATNSLVYVSEKHVCDYYWRFYISGGSANPSSGSAVWSVTLNGDTQNVTVDFDMTAAELKTHLLAQFSGLASADLDCRGGPLPEVALDIQWKRDFIGHAVADYPPTVGTNTLNNSASMHMHDWNPRS